jgi:hypothetical protein
MQAKVFLLQVLEDLGVAHLPFDGGEGNKGKPDIALHQRLKVSLCELGHFFGLPEHHLVRCGQATVFEEDPWACILGGEGFQDRMHMQVCMDSSLGMAKLRTGVEQQKEGKNDPGHVKSLWPKGTLPSSPGQY